MIDFKNALRLLVVLLAYGLTGHLDHEDELRLAQGLVHCPAVDRSPKCPLPDTERFPGWSVSQAKGAFATEIVAAGPASSNSGALDTANPTFDLPCLHDGL
jgi:hypothetical protein